MEKQRRTAEGSRGKTRLRGTAVERRRYGAGIFLLILLSVAACERGIDAVPHYLIGTWTTSARAYAGRFMKFGEHTLVLGVGNGEEVLYEIRRIDVRHDGGEVFTLHYDDPEGENGMITFTYRSASGGTLQLNHSEHLWKKARPGGDDGS